MEHKSNPPWKYDLAIEGKFMPDGSFGSILIDLGNSPEWIDKFADELLEAERISLIPKKGEKMPVVSVNLTGEKQWIFYSNVFGSITDGTGIEFRAYCIGWKLEVVRLDGFDDEAYVGDGRVRSIKSLTWVYPNGTIENGENPMLAESFLKAATKTHLEAAQQ